MSRKLNVLVVDDTEPNLLLVSKFIAKLGHKTVMARNGREAVDRFREERFDLILMDIMMPEMDGYEATAEIRKISDRWVPIIFLTAKSQDADHVKGIQVGGDDYLTKPVNLVILEARIKAITRIAEMQQQIMDYAAQLELYRDENERDLQLAKHLIDNISRHEQIDRNIIRVWNRPAQHLSGDIIISARTPADEIHILLADGTGHGLPAALNVIPVVEAFYGMSFKGFGISSIARELNRKVRQLMPTERFVAATIASINPGEKTVDIWNGGNPPAWFVAGDGSVKRAWKSVNPALGILADDAFNSATEVYQWDAPGHLYMCSDGLLEAQNVEGVEFGVERLETILALPSREDRFHSLTQAVEHHMRGAISHDDISVGEIRCASLAYGESPPVRPAIHDNFFVAEDDNRWKIFVRLTASELKNIDVVPMLLAWMDQLHLDRAHRGQVFLIFSELFNNALDHGVLGLDSLLKFEADGFERYVDERRQRINLLQHGTIEVEVERIHEQGSEFLSVRFKDSGSGFDYRAVEEPHTIESTRPFGRGLALVKNLCVKLAFSGCGNEVCVVYALT